MNIMEYDLENLDCEELLKLFSIFKEASEKEGHTAIAIPKDITILQDVDEKVLYQIKKMIDEELKRKAKESEEEFRAKFKTRIDEICFGEFKCQG
jgi:hypothetical protein